MLWLWRTRWRRLLLCRRGKHLDAKVQRLALTVDRLAKSLLPACAKDLGASTQASRS